MKIAVNGKYRRKSDWQGSDAVANNRSLNRAKWVDCSAFVHLHFEYSGTSTYMNSFIWISTEVNCRLYHEVYTKRQTQIYIAY